MSTATETTAVTTLPRTKPLPLDRYNFRILKGEAKRSQLKADGKGNNRYINFQVEIYNPETIRHNSDGVVYNIAGLKSNLMLMIETPADLTAAEKFMALLGMSGKLDQDNPDIESFVGKTYSNKAGAKQYELRKDPTFEQLQADPNAKGDVFVNPETGQPEVGYSIDCGFCLRDVYKATAPSISA